MPAAKKTDSKKKPASRARSANGKAKRPTKTKYVLPKIETTALEKSLSPGESKKKQKPRKVKKVAKQQFSMPGYFAFTVEVWQVLWSYKSIFLRLIVAYALLSGLFVAYASQAVYTQLSSLLREAGGEVIGGNTAKIGEASELLLAGLTGAANPEIGEAQQVIGGFLVILTWLTTVWLLRAFLAGHSPGLRDGFYNSGTPLVPTLILSLLFIVQLVPAAVAVIAVAAAIPTGLVSGGFVMVLFWVAILLLVLLSLYWITSTFIAMIVVTLPGMYPMKALSTARELVAGRRLRIVLRMLWVLIVSICAWMLIMVPMIVFDAWLKGVWNAIEWVPIVPTAFLLASSITLIWVASYSYLLYRKVVDNDAVSA